MGTGRGTGSGNREGDREGTGRGTRWGQGVGTGGNVAFSSRVFSNDILSHQHIEEFLFLKCFLLCSWSVEMEPIFSPKENISCKDSLSHLLEKLSLLNLSADRHALLPTDPEHLKLGLVLHSCRMASVRSQ